MAEISKLSGVAIANVAKVDAILKASIANINDLTIPSAFTGIFDTYSGGAAGYSTRRLYGQYTGAALRVREDSGDTETDIGFDSNGDLDTAAIATHCGTANGYVTTWYGQDSSGGTGSGNDATQTASANQPQIYDGSAVITENGKPAVSFLGTRYLVTPFDTSSADFDLPQTMYLATRIVSPGSYLNFSFIICGGGVSFSLGKFEMVAQQGVGTSTQYRTTTTVSDSVSNYTDTAMYLHGGYYGSSLVKTAYNGAALTSGASITEGDYTNTALAIGGTGTTSNGTFKVSEYLLWHSDQSTNKSGIETNINAHFQIGNFPNPTSGLLATYTGAAAAYSVRQLANTAALAMRIREDGGDTETDIGFDSNGDLDTAAIASHCGSNNGYVVTWYDQSGNQNDAAQGTSGNQPQIYDGASVVGDNGKPALDFDGANSGDRLEISTSLGITGTTSRSFYCVLNPHAAGTPSITRTYIGLGDGTTAANSDKYNLSAEWSVRVYGGNEVYSSVTTNTQYLSTNIHNGTNVTDNSFYLNGSEQTATSSGSTTLATSNTVQYIAADGSGGVNRYNGTIQEVLIWASDQSSNRTGIESDINTYFSIY